MPPVVPGKNAIGTNTATSTSVMPTTAEVICVIAFTVATYGDNRSSDMMRSTFSITTIASSTRMPIAITMANSVSTLIEKPSTQRPRHAPARAIGTTMVGMSVARQFWRNRNITRNTSIIASTSVSTTDSTDALTNGVESYGTDQAMSCGNPTASSAMRAFTALATASAFAPGVSWIAMPAAGCPFISMSKPYD